MEPTNHSLAFLSQFYKEKWKNIGSISYKKWLFIKNGLRGENVLVAGRFHRKSYN